MIILHKKIAGLSEPSLSRFVLRARRVAGLRGAVNVLISTSSAMRALNQQFRIQNKDTDVLSFPAASIAANGKKAFAGEIAISAEIAAQNAAHLGHSVALEIKVLVLHGILHLAGFDHERDNGEMARKEAKCRRALRLPLSLTERSLAGAISTKDTKYHKGSLRDESFVKLRVLRGGRRGIRRPA
ncbi:MAG: rRNA maturation RNase YbeY [Candidatus Sulfotelmatobacter sp.]